MLSTLVLSLLISIQPVSLRNIILGPAINFQPLLVPNTMIVRRSSFMVPVSVNQRNKSVLPSRLDALAYNNRKNEIYPVSIKLRNDIDQTAALEVESRLKIWEISNNEMHRADITDYRDFKSTSSYIVSVQETPTAETLNENSENWNIYYWIGEYSIGRDVTIAAVKAVELDYQIHSTTRIRRETERHESPTFKAIFKEDESSASSSEHATIIDSEALDVNHINPNKMFVIEGRRKLTLKTVKLSLDKIIKNEKKCFVVTGKRIHVFCGMGASEQQKEAANVLSRIILQKIAPDFQEEPIIIDRKYEPPTYQSFDEFHKLLEFYEEISRIEESEEARNYDNNSWKFTSTELRRVLQQTKIQDNGIERFNFGLTRIYKGIFGIQSVPEYCTDLQIKMLNTHDCYLKDSRSHAGLFVLMGKNSKIDVRMASVKKAEMYRIKIGYHYTMPMIFVDKNDVPPEVQSLQDIIRTMKCEHEEDV